jgi:hypothetical protein
MRQIHIVLGGGVPEPMHGLHQVVMGPDGDNIVPLSTRAGHGVVSEKLYSRRQVDNEGGTEP